MRLPRSLLASVLVAAAWAQPARAALEGEWVGSFASVELCGREATLSEFRLRITSAPYLHLPSEQFRYAKANITGPAEIAVASRAPGQVGYALSGMFVGGLVAATPEPMLVGYLVTQPEYEIWRRRKPFAPPTDGIEVRWTVHGDWTSTKSMTGSLRGRAECTPGDPSDRLVLNGVLSKP